jgi:hypothetical protein
MWYLHERFEDIIIITTNIDEYTQGKLIPGIFNLEDRYSNGKKNIQTNVESTNIKSPDHIHRE